jgi:phosphonate transport system substrate-binding protein
MARSKPERTTSRPSTALLAVAVATTVLVVLFGSVVVWRLYESAYAAAEPRAATSVDSAAEPLRVGVARSPGGPNEWITFAKVLAQLQRDLNRPLVVRYALSSEDQIRLFERGEIDVALMSTLAYLDVQDAGLVQMVATPVVLDQPRDAAVIVVSSDSSANRIEDLRGKRFAVSADLAGVSFTYWLLQKRGISPKGFFSATPAGVQDENLTKVATGKADATSVRRSALARWPKGTFKVIESSPALGMPPIVARASLDASTIAHVRRSLLTAVARGVVPTSSAITGFQANSDADYDFARVLDAIDRDAELGAFGVSHQ